MGPGARSRPSGAALRPATSHGVRHPSGLRADLRALAAVLAPAAAPGGRPGIERAGVDAADGLDEARLERSELFAGAGRPGERARLGEVEPQARRRRQGLVGRRVAQAAPGAAEGIGRELRVGVHVGLAAGAAGLVVDDLGRAVGRPVQAVHVADEADGAGLLRAVARERHVHAEAELDRDRLRSGSGLEREEAVKDGHGPPPSVLDLVGREPRPRQLRVERDLQGLAAGPGRALRVGSDAREPKRFERLVDGVPEGELPGADLAGPVLHVPEPVPQRAAPVDGDRRVALVGRQRRVGHGARSGHGLGGRVGEVDGGHETILRAGRDRSSGTRPGLAAVRSSTQCRNIAMLRQ